MVAGRVRLKLYKGGVYVIGRDSPHSLYDQDLVTFEEGAVAYDHNDAAGFIKLNALRLRTLAKRRKRRLKGTNSKLIPASKCWRRLGFTVSCRRRFLAGG